MHPEATVVLVGAGNRSRGDDGAGPAVAERVAAKRIPGLRIVQAGDDAVALLDVWDGADELFVVDACRCGAEPGVVHRLDAAAAALASPSLRPSSHGLGVVEALQLARRVDRLPPTVWLFAIEVGVCGLGSPLSAPVAAAVERVAAELIALCARPRVP